VNLLSAFFLNRRPWLSSLAVHGLIVVTMVFALSHDGARVEGGAGLAGSPRTRTSALVVDLEEVSAPPLPENLKARPREIDTPPPPAAAEAPAQGNSDDEPAGSPGQGGTEANASAERIGDADRSNALGLYLAKIQRRVQAELRSPGFLARSARAQLRFYLRSNGNVARIEIVKSAGDRRLDLLAIDAVKRAQPFEPFDRDLNVNIPVLFNSRSL